MRRRSSSASKQGKWTVERRSLLASVKAFVCRIDVCWTFFFFLFLLAIGCTITAIAQTKIGVALRVSLGALHNARIFDTQKRMDLVAERAYSIVTGYLTLHSQRSFAVNTEKSIATLCSILAVFDTKGIIRLFSVGSVTKMEAVACMHGDAVLNRAVLYGWVTENTVTTGTYIVDNATYQFRRPLEEVYGGWPDAAKNITNTLRYLAHYNSAFVNAVGYYNGTVDSINQDDLWTMLPGVPHIISYAIPAALTFRGLAMPASMDPTDFVQVRLDGTQLLKTDTDYFSSSTASAILVNTSLSDADPLIMSNNWGQQSVNDTQLVTSNGNVPISYLSVGTTTSPLLRAALKHVNLKALQSEGERRDVFFQYKGAPAIVTATIYESPRGLRLPMVFVTPQEEVTGPYSRTMSICTGVTAIGVLVVTALFWWSIHAFFHAPLQRITDGMLRNLRTGHRDLPREPHFQLMQLRETQALVNANADCIRRLREIQTFIPEGVRRELLRGNGISASSRMQLSIRGPAAHCSSPGRPGATLQEHLSTVVYLTLKPDLVFEKSRTEAVFLHSTPDVPQRHLLATVVANAARSVSLVNSGPFASPDDLADFVAVVHDLCRRYNGAVLRLSPDNCILHFHHRARGHLHAKPPLAKCSASTDKEGELESAQALLSAAEDAKDALAFTFDLQRWLEHGNLHIAPKIQALVDTSTFVCGKHRPKGSEQTLTVALGRDVRREASGILEKIDVRVAMTEETAKLVRGNKHRHDTVDCEDDVRAVRQLPVESIRTGRVGLDEDVVVLFEALPGPAEEDEAWQRYQLCCFRAFSFMVRGDYTAALLVYKDVMDIPNLEPGLMPTSLRREAAATNVTGGAVSVQVERLMRECTRRIRQGNTSCFCRYRGDPLGIDTVLRGVPHSTPSPRKHSRAARVLAHTTDAAVVAKREGRFGVESHNATFTRTEGRNVGILPGTDIRTSYTGRPNSITDNWGTKWVVAKKLVADRGHNMYDSLYSGLSETGNLCALTFLLYREVPAMVSRVLRDAPAGAMTDAMRSAVPVWQPTPPQRAAVCALLDARMRLRHPHILACLGYSLELEGGVMTALEYCKGGNLREVMARYDRVRVPTVCRTALSVLLGLRYLHAHGVVHGELRPECVLVCSDGVCRLKGFFADYALAHRVLCIPRTCYVSPEVAAGAAPTAASDIFGYGLVLLELLTQRLPWAWAAGDGAEAPRSAEDLAALAAAGGQAFSDAVVQGLVVPAVDALDDPEVLAKGSPLGYDLLRCCLSREPKERLALNCLIAHAERIAAKHGVFPSQPSDAPSGTAQTDTISFFSA